MGYNPRDRALLQPALSKPMEHQWKKRIRDRLSDLDMSMKAASLGAGQGETFVRDILERNRVPSIEKFIALASVLNMSAAELIGDGPLDDREARYDSDDQKSIGSETGVRGVPRDSSPEVDVTAGMGAGGLTIVSDGVPGRDGMTFSAEHVRDYWRLPPRIVDAIGTRAHDIAIIPVQGDSMQPTLGEGDFVFIDTRHRLPSPDGVYALADEFGGIVVKRLEVSSKPGADDATVRIISDNDRHQPRELLLSEVHIIGRVVKRFTNVG